MIRSLALAGLLALGACSTPPPPPAATPPPAAPGLPVADACGAATLQQLLGHSRSDIPVAAEPQRQRVACTTCPVTQDYDPARLNFFFDADTGLIRQIRCG